jgi:dihydropyrimidinase/allantoinase
MILMEMIKMADLNIRNGKIFFGNRLIEAGLSIKDGKIIAIAKDGSLPPAEKTIDASGRIIVPGAIDVHTHIEDLDYSEREDFITGTQAAASGGVTTILEMPVGIEGKSALEAFDLQLDIMRKRCIVDFGIIGAAGYNNIDSIREFSRRGVVGFKTFMTNPPEEEAELRNLAAKDDYFLSKIFSEIAQTGLVSSVHAENDAIVTHEVERLKSEGRKDFQAHTESRPAIAEDEACLRAILLAHQANVSLNLVHMSSKNAFEIIREAKYRRCNITCEITPHHLFLTCEDGNKIGSWAKVDPPLRQKEHVMAAWKALNDRTIDMIASDHSPYHPDEKNIALRNSNIFECGSGTPGVETLIPVMLDAVNNNKISLERLVCVTSENPAKRFALYPRKGTIAINADADLLILNMKEEYILKNEMMFTKPKITVFNGMKVRGSIEKTIIRGTVVYDKGKFCVKEGYGNFITPQRILMEE